MKKLFFLSMLMVLYASISAQNHKFQALFIYNIVRLVEWPAIDNSFVIGVVGSKEMYRELQSLSQKHKISGHPIEVRTINPSQLMYNDCHVIYVGRSSSNKVEQVVSQIDSKPILLIGDKVGLNGVAINFIDNSENISFEIYPSLIKSHQLSLSNSLLSLGTVKE